MANIIISIDEKTAERARSAAQAMGTSLDQLLRDHIERLSGLDQRKVDHDAYEARALAVKGRLIGWKFNREQVNSHG